MSSDRAFLADILANPDDDAPRLVYADWLEEHGDPIRAGFIHLQIEHARLPTHDPRRREMVEREKAMLAEHAAAWRSDLPAWTRREVCWFRRGFVAQVSASERQFVRGAAALSRKAPPGRRPPV